MLTVECSALNAPVGDDDDGNGKDDLVIMLLLNNYVSVVLSLKVTDVMLLVRVT